MQVAGETEAGSDNEQKSAADVARDRIRTFKLKVIWRLCTDLLDPPLPPIERLKLNDDMSEYEKGEARRKHTDALLNRELELKKRGPELLGKLEDIMLRVVQSRTEQVIDNMEVWTPQKVERVGLEFECDVCGNNNQKHFLRDGQTGDTVCLGRGGRGCGNVVQDHRVEEGSQFRTFADDDGKDRNHHGPVPDKLMPDSENLKTALLGAGSTFKMLNQLNQVVESNLGNSDDRRTRTSYRNQHKRDAFNIMEDTAEQLGIHDSVVSKAREEFARFRDVREHVISYHGVVAACLCIAFQELVLSNKLSADLKRGAKEVQSTGPSTWVHMVDHTLDAKQAIAKVALSDPVLNILPDKPLKYWSAAEMESWLHTVLKSGETAACAEEQTRMILNELTGSENKRDSSSESGASSSVKNVLAGMKKRSHSDSSTGKVPSWMGSTTTASRAKKSKLNNGAPNPNDVSSHNKSEIGHSFLRMDLDNVITDKSTVTVLKTAIKSRLRFEAWAASKMAEHELEEKRLVQERTDYRMRNIAGKNEGKRIEEINLVSAAAGQVEDDLLKAMMNAAPVEDTRETIPQKNIPGPRIRTVISGRASTPKVVVKTAAAIKPLSEVDESMKAGQEDDSKDGKYFYKNGKRMRIVKQTRTDSRTGKQITVSFEEEAPIGWGDDSDEDEQTCS